MPERISSNKLTGVNLAETLVKHRSLDDANSVNQRSSHNIVLGWLRPTLFCGYVGGWVMVGGAGEGNLYHMLPCHFSHWPTVVIRFLSFLFLPYWSDYLREKLCFRSSSTSSDLWQEHWGEVLNPFPTLTKTQVPSGDFIDFCLRGGLFLWSLTQACWQKGIYSESGWCCDAEVHVFVHINLFLQRGHSEIVFWLRYLTFLPCQYISQNPLK